MNDMYDEGYHSALEGHPRESCPTDDAEEWLAGWDAATHALATRKPKYRLDTIRLENGRLTTTLFKWKNTPVAKIEDHMLTADELLSLAREFYAKHPKLFADDVTLLDTAEQSEQKNPKLFGDGELETFPEQ